MKIVILAVTLLTLFGCVESKGFDRGALSASLQAEREQSTDKDIKDALELKPHAAFPLKLAMYLQPTKVVGPYNYSSAWTKAEKDALQEWGNRLQAEGIISDLRLISNTAVTGEQIRDIRLAAARHGADAVLIISSAFAVDRYNNALAVLYGTGLGLYVIPGTQSDALVMMDSSLWDTRTGYLYATQEAEGFSASTGPAFMLQPSESVREAKRSAIESLNTKWQSRLRFLARKQVTGYRRAD